MKNTVVPKLRFPEFREARAWEEKALGDVAEVITGNTPSTIEPENYGGEKMFVSPADIGEERYITRTKTTLTEKGYSQTRHVKENSVLFVCIGSTIGKVAQNKYECATNQQLNSVVPYEGYSSGFIYSALEYNSLKIASLAGLHAVPIINKTVFSSVLLRFPPTEAEQQKIAACLTSLDDLISAEGERLKALQAHKKGLMQQLFPAEGETVPRRRFGEFEGDWEIGTLGDICKVASGGTPNRGEKNYWDGGNIPWVTTTLIDSNVIDKASEFITEEGLQNSSAKIFPKNTILMAMYGQGKTRGKVAVLGIDAATNQACAAIILKDGFDTRFVFQYLASRYDEIRKISNSGGQENLSAGLIESIPFAYPNIKTTEQQKIAACLTSLDDLIAAQGQKLAGLKEVKKGLMQGMFPAAPLTG